MSGKTVRVSNKTAETLKDIAREKGDSVQKVLDRAVEEHRRTLFLEEANKAYADLKENPRQWKEEQEEREIWSNTLTDGQEVDYN
ncbi:MAG: toxin-antitoxin system protein [Bacillota bacterium]